MILYHASDCIIKIPDVHHSRDLLDFGKGFYLTSFEEQARKYALRFTFQSGEAYVNKYELDERLDGFTRKEFVSYDEEWLDYVTLCRVGKQTEHYDIISGGIADDKVFNTVDLYFSEIIGKEEALRRLAFVHPNHQICITCQTLLEQHLHFLSVEKI